MIYYIELTLATLQVTGLSWTFFFELLSEVFSLLEIGSKLDALSNLTLELFLGIINQIGLTLIQNSKTQVFFDWAVCSEGKAFFKIRDIYC